MFDHINSAQKQNLADSLKVLIENALSSPAQKRSAQRALTLFEATDWQPLALTRAMATHAPHFAVDGFSVSYTGTDDVCAVLVTVLDSYYLIINPPIAEMYSAHQAAAYLHIGYPALKQAIYRAGTLHPQKFGSELCFTQADLDGYKQTALKPGQRKAQKPKSEAATS